MKGKKKRIIAFFLAVMTFIGLSTAQAETVLHPNGVTINQKTTGNFLEENPNIKIEEGTYTYYQTTGELITALTTRNFPYDLFNMSSIIDYRPIMEKGFCLDLSSNEVIRNRIEKLYPVYYEQVANEDGKIYAIPTSLQFNFLSFNVEYLEEAGYQLDEVPSTFPGFLDFLEEWVAFIQDEMPDVAICGSGFWGAEEFYHEWSYTAFLVEELLDEYIMQKAHAGEALRFNNPELIAMLNRCASIGKELYTYDKGCSVAPSIIAYGVPTSLNAETSPKKILFLRLSEDQPKMISILIYLISAYAGTEHPEEVISLMQALLENNDAKYDAYMYQDGEPVPNPNYEKNLAHQQELISATKQQLERDALELSENDELTWTLEAQQKILDELLHNEEKKYTVTSSQLSQYREYVDALYVEMPSVFNPNTEAGKTFRNLQARFSQGQMTAEELVKELDRIAEMVEMEEGA